MPYAENAAIEQWLAQTPPEDVLEPDLPIIDPHHHLWDLRDTPAPWAQKVYLCDEMAEEIRASGHNVVQTVFAQCNAFYRADGPEEMRCVGETEFVHGVAAMSRSGKYGPARLCTGIFSGADLRPGKAVEPVLQAHLDASPNFRGIRTAFPSDLDPQFMDGYATLAKLGLSFDHYSPDCERLPILARLAEAQPDVPIIVNHLGGKIDPDASPAAVSRWQECIDSVAGCPNVVMKCGGAQQRAGRDWQPPFHMDRRAEGPLGSEELCDLLYPFYRYAIEAFGPARCMFESNFPVDKESVSYRTLWNLMKRIAAKMGLSEAEKTELFSGTAARVYQLDMAGSAG